MSGRLDDEKLETLRSWGTGLAADERDELRAAGKAILILVDEIDRLQVDLWHDRGNGPSRLVREPEPAQPEPAQTGSELLIGDTPEPPPQQELDSRLMARVRRLLGARS